MKRLVVLVICVVIALSIVSCNTQSADPAVSPAERFNISSGYDMEGERGSWILVTDYFRLRLPEDLEQYELAVEQPEYESLDFSYWYPTGEYRGESLPLFRLTGYELGDNSYQELEGYVEAGQDSRHRYIVTFADEDGEGSPKAERYRELKEFFQDLRPEAGDANFIVFPG